MLNVPCRKKLFTNQTAVHVMYLVLFGRGIVLLLILRINTYYYSSCAFPRSVWFASCSCCDVTLLQPLPRLCACALPLGQKWGNLMLLLPAYICGVFCSRQKWTQSVRKLNHIFDIHVHNQMHIIFSDKVVYHKTHLKLSLIHI